jgi:hypothetical protein
MDIYHSYDGVPCLTLTTPEELEVVSIVANNNFAKCPTIFHPNKRRVHSDLARRAFDAVHQISDTFQPFPLTGDETAIVAMGMPNLENALLELDGSLHYTTNTMSRDATALCIAEALKKLNTKE